MWPSYSAKAYGNSWANELGADFFVGIREEMLGLGKSNFEKTLGATKTSISHPGGELRIKAIEYGRQVAAEMKKTELFQPGKIACRSMLNQLLLKWIMRLHQALHFLVSLSIVSHSTNLKQIVVQVKLITGQTKHVKQQTEVIMQKQKTICVLPKI